jgi:nucleoside-diphosphate-sugar epimerase
MRTFLVTGGAGFIGSHIAEALVARGDRVRVLDNLCTGKLSNLDHLKGQIEFIEGDVTDAGAVAKAVKAVDCIFHEAALASVPRSVERPLDTHAACVTGTLTVLDEARKAGVRRLVYAASSSAYGDQPTSSKRESDLPAPISPYGAAKLAAEFYCQAFTATYGFQTVSIRYFNVFGPRQDPEGAYAAVIPKWIAALIQNDEVYINGDGTTARDFCYIDNVVQANLLAATTEDPAAINQIYNVAYGAQTTLEELFQMIRLLVASYDPAVMGRHAHHRDFRPGDMHISQADVGKAKSLLRYDPDWDVREGMKWTVDHYIAALGPSSGTLLAAGEGPRHIVTEVRP